MHDCSCFDFVWNVSLCNGCNQVCVSRAAKVWVRFTYSVRGEIGFVSCQGDHNVGTGLQHEH